MAIAVLDVGYGDVTQVACGQLTNWQAARANLTVHKFAAAPAGYESGAFWKRELPFLLRVLNGLDWVPHTIVVDAYVWLEDGTKPGMGARLYEALGQKVPVVGVAKTEMKGDACSVPVLRGNSQRPLFVTAAGLDPARAAQHVRSMAGPYRIPDVLAQVDRASRELK
jgi:deoxyribonuclease V